jgi:hypothetical protein
VLSSDAGDYGGDSRTHVRHRRSTIRGFPGIGTISPNLDESKGVALPGLSSNAIRLWLDNLDQLRRVA